MVSSKFWYLNFVTETHTIIVGDPLTTEETKKFDWSKLPRTLHVLTLTKCLCMTILPLEFDDTIHVHIPLDIFELPYEELEKELHQRLYN